jgi:HEAT repeat protein
LGGGAKTPKVEKTLGVLFGIAVLAWFTVSACTLCGRVLYDRRRRSPSRQVPRVARLLRAAAPGRSALRRWRRLDALRTLARMGHPESLSLLAAALEDDDEEIVGGAVKILGGVPSEEAAEILAKALRAGLYPRARIAAQLDGFALEIGDLLLPLLHDERAEVRFWAVTLLARYCGGDGVAAKVASLTDDPDPNVRAAVAETLGVHTHSATRAARLRLVRDDVWYVRVHAARSLRDLRADELVTSLAPLLADEEWSVRAAARQALEAKGRYVVAPILRYLDHSDTFARNSIAEVLQNVGLLDDLVAEAAHRPGDGETIELLRKVLAAGGARLADASLARVGSASARLQELVDRVSPSGVRA